MADLTGQVTGFSGILHEIVQFFVLRMVQVVDVLPAIGSQALAPGNVRVIPEVFTDDILSPV